MNKLPYDIIGVRFGRLTVIERIENTKDGKAQFKCHCDCGQYKDVRAKSLRNGDTKSCGCLLSEESRKRATSHGKCVRVEKHGKCHSRLYNIWSGMKQRCFNPNATKYELYGGRGITVCEEWKDDFQAFYDWAMSNGYEEHLTIDRIDSDMNYEPNNCQWITLSENGRKGNIKRNSNKGVVKNGVTQERTP